MSNAITSKEAAAPEPRTAGPTPAGSGGASARLLSRRTFLSQAALVAGGLPLGFRFSEAGLRANQTGAANRLHRNAAKVAIVPCRTYGPEVRTALTQSFDLLGGIGSLVKNQTVTVKINLTGSDFSPFLNRPVGETYMTHYTTAISLGSLLFAAGARRVRFVESTNRRSDLAGTLGFADWDVKALEALGAVEFENTRNLGHSKQYARLTVPSGGYLFFSFEFNRSYADTDVLISLAKLKTHVTAGVTLSMKNLFGITPNALYSGRSGDEGAVEGRQVLHSSRGFDSVRLPGLKPNTASDDAGFRVPRIVADICGARPIHLAIIDGITSMSGGEGPWCLDTGRVKVVTPGVLIVGLNPVSTDAVATAVMGFSDPRAIRGKPPFEDCDNHLLLAEQAGVGIADLAQIEVLGSTIAKARCPYN